MAVYKIKYTFVRSRKKNMRITELFSDHKEMRKRLNELYEMYPRVMGIKTVETRNFIVSYKKAGRTYKEKFFTPEGRDTRASKLKKMPGITEVTIKDQ